MCQIPFIGNGTIIMHGAVVNANVEIGSNCIINSKLLDMELKLEIIVTFQHQQL